MDIKRQLKYISLLSLNAFLTASLIFTFPVSLVHAQDNATVPTQDNQNADETYLAPIEDEAEEGATPSGIIDSRSNNEIHLIKGDLEAIKVYSLVRISVSDPEVADIANADSDQVLMLAKKAGHTALFVWDEYGKRTIIIRVFNEDLKVLEDRLNVLLEKSDITGLTVDINEYEGKVILTGELNAKKKEELEGLIAPFRDSIMDLTKAGDIEDLVQIDVQIAEINASITKNLGIDWSDAVNVVEGLPGNNLVNAGGGQVPYADEIFKVGKLYRTTSVSAIINAAVTEGKGRILSKPKLVVKSGKEASFLVGGEIPITTTNTSAGGNVQENVQFKDFGISLTILPTIRGEMVDVVMSVEVSDIDTANAVGQNVAFSTRSAQTQLFLDNGQSVVLAGLIKHTEGETVSKVPFLGDIPLIGLIFRSKNVPNNADTELVISLTPTILRQSQVAKEKVKKEKEELKAAAKEELKKEEAAVEEVNIDEPPPGIQQSAEAVVEKEEPQPPVSSESESPKVDVDNLVEVEQASKAVENKALVDAYVKTIQQRIAQSIAYPFEAKEKGWQGTVKLKLHLLSDGYLSEVSVKESSGYSVFDKDALNTAQILAPYERFPTELTLNELIVTVPIIYSQDAAFKDLSCRVNIPAANPTKKLFVPGNGQTYSQAVQKRIADAIVYPDQAREYGWEGTVKLALHILEDGTLAYVAVKESSGHEVFDECALQTAKNLAPYSVFPSESDLQEINVTVPIEYSLER